MKSVGYDVYDVYDLGEFDQKNVGACRTKYGTKDELLELAKTAKEHDVVIYVDAVFNHKFGADDKERFKVREVDRNDRTRAISDPYDILVRYSIRCRLVELIMTLVVGLDQVYIRREGQ